MHTPGPWRVGLDKQAWNSPSSIRGTVERATNGAVYLLAEVCYPSTAKGTVGYDERLANTLLVAAAPDLLEALRLIVRAYDGPTVDVGTAISSHITEARVAIAKAEGRA